MTINNGRRMMGVKKGNEKTLEFMGESMEEVSQFERDLKKGDLVTAEVKLAIAKQRGIDPIILKVLAKALADAKNDNKKK
ncbi:MAG: hypothetical protein WC471_03810 [Candidatus Woesearchaeota archaeon]